MIYRTLYYEENPFFDYQYKKGAFYKREHGSKDKWYKVDPDGQKKLQKYFSNKMSTPIWNISPIAILGGSALLILGAYVAYKKLSK